MKKILKVTLFGILLSACAGLSVACSKNPTESSNPETSISGDSTSISHAHSYGVPTWNWSEDKTTATATFTCSCGDVQVINAQVTKQTTPATTTVAGEEKYDAVVEFNNTTYMDRKTVIIPVIVNHDHGFSEEWSSDANHHWHACECGEKESYGNHIVAKKANRLKDPTCSQTGVEESVSYCSVCGYIISSKTKSISLKEHTYSVLVTSASVEPTCMTQGYDVFKCSTCDKQLVLNKSALGHSWNQEPTCEVGAYCTREGCKEIKPALGHDYVKNEDYSEPATCLDNSNDVYVCSRCSDTLIAHETHAEGHDFISSWNVIDKHLVEGKACTYKYVYKNICSKCGEVIKEDDQEIVEHSLISKIITPATCVSDGEKGLYCTTCEQVISSSSYSEPDAHDWDEDVNNSTASVKAYICNHEGCLATKKVVDNSNSISATVESSDIVEAKEVKLEKGSLVFDDTTTQVFEGKTNIEIEIDTVDPTSLDLDDETLAKVNGDVFDFNINTNEGKISQFDGAIKVRIPYALNDEDDVDCIVVSYINDDNELENINAKYVEDTTGGYLEFETNHFSYYCVTFMTPAERCAKYGHRYSETRSKEATCVEDGYEFQFCSRCGDVNIFNVVKATGHSYVEDANNQDATCTHVGHKGYHCEKCDAAYSEDTAALGHDYTVTTVQPTCTQAGSVTYHCNRDCQEDGCDYVVSLAPTGHSYIPVVTKEATCTEEGKTELVCSICGEKDVNSEPVVIPAIGHDFVLVSETSTEYVYKCSHCNEQKINKKASSATFSKSYASEANFFTKVPDLIKDNEMTLTANDIEFSYDDANNPMLVKVNDVELHVSFLDDQIAGYAHFTVHTEMSGVDKDVEAMAYLYNNMLYVYSSSPLGGSGVSPYPYYNVPVMTYRQIDGNSSYQVIDFNNLKVNPDLSLKQLLEYILEGREFFDEEVMPYLQKLVNSNKESVNNVFFNLFNYLLQVSPTADGGFVFSLDFDKISNLNNDLATKTIVQIFDTIFGENKANELIDEVCDMMDSSFKVMLNHLKDKYGFDYKEFVELIDKGVARFSEYGSLRDLIYNLSNKSFDLDEYLSDNYLENHSIRGLIKDNSPVFVDVVGDSLLKEFVKKWIKDNIDKPVYSLISDRVNTEEWNASKIKDMVANYIEAARNSNIYIYTTATGEFKSVKASVNFEYENIKVKGRAEFTFDSYVSSFSYDTFVAFINNIDNSVRAKSINDTVLLEQYINSRYGGNYYTLNINKDNNGKITSFNYYQNHTSYQIFNNEFEIVAYEGKESPILSYYREHVKDGGQIAVCPSSYYEFNLSDPRNVSINQICSNSYNVTYNFGGICKYVYLIKVADTEGNITDDILEEEYSYTTSMSFSCLFDGKNITPTSSSSTNRPEDHKLVLLEDESIIRTGCNERSEYHYVCSDCGTHFIGEIGNSHKYEFVERRLEDDHGNCRNGVEYVYRCSECGIETIERKYDHTFDDVKNIVLDDGNVLKISSCFCEERDVEMVGFVDEYATCYVTFKKEYNGYSFYYANGILFSKYENGKTIYYFLFEMSDRDENDSCVTKNKLVLCKGRVDDSYFYVDGNDVAYEENLPDTYQHDYYVEPIHTIVYNEETDRYSVPFHCAICGEEKTMELGSWDNYEVRYDLTKYSSYGHDDGYVSFYYHTDEKYFHSYSFHDYCSTSSEYIYQNPSTNEFLKVYSCASSFDDCTFHYYHKAHLVNEDCKTYLVHEYGLDCDEQGNNPTDIIIESKYQVSNNHDADIIESTPINLPLDHFSCEFVESICKVCGADYDYYDCTFDHKGCAYEEETTIRNADGSYVVYPAHYCPICGFVEYDDISNTYEYIRYYDSSDFCYRTDEISYSISYAGIRVSTTVSEYTKNSNGESILLKTAYTNKWYYFDGTETINTEVFEYVYSFIDLNRFKQILKDEFDLEYNDTAKCYRICVNSDSYDNYSHTYYRFEKYHGNTKVIGNTCSQYGYKICADCGTVIDSRYSYPTRHHFDWDDEENCYICELCGLHSYKPYSGEIVLEDCSHLDESGDNVIVGYYPDYYIDDYDQFAFIEYVDAEGNEDASVIENKVFTPTYYGSYIGIAKADIVDAISKLPEGSTVNNVYVGFMPKYGSMSYDYLLKFTPQELSLA